MILNLIVNALEAVSGMGQGSRELQISAGKSEPADVLVAVRESGPGLDPDAMEHLFKAFYTTKPNGLGMGLSICRSIVEAHGGRMGRAPIRLAAPSFNSRCRSSWTMHRLDTIAAPNTETQKTGPAANQLSALLHQMTAAPFRDIPAGASVRF